MKYVILICIIFISCGSIDTRTEQQKRLDRAQSEDKEMKLYADPKEVERMKKEEADRVKKEEAERIQKERSMLEKNICSAYSQIDSYNTALKEMQKNMQVQGDSGKTPDSASLNQMKQNLQKSNDDLKTYNKEYQGKYKRYFQKWECARLKK
jgi:hypothetical protein